jgi:hypothetical protein
MVKNLPPGVAYQSGVVAGRNYEYTIIAKTWAQVLDQAAQRLNFFKAHIGYSPSFSQGREYLNAVYRKFIPVEAQTTQVVHVGQSGDAIPITPSIPL